MTRDEIYNYLLETFDIISDLDLDEISNNILNYRFNINKNEKIVIYGAGNIGKITYKNLINNGYSVKCFLDKKAEEIKECLKKNVYKADEFFLNNNDEDYIVFIAILLNSKEKEELLNYLNQIGYKKVIYDEYYLLGFNECIVRDLPLCNINERKNDIIDAFNLFEDSESKEIFAKSLRARATLNFDDIIFSNNTVQYFKPNINLKKGFSNFIDCGAFIGDTLEELMKYYRCDSYVGFEPDTKNYNLLIENSKKYSQDIKEIKLFQYATSNKNSVQRFSTLGNGMSSSLNENGEIEVKTVRLDDLLKENKITMIKMDIEGAELDTIKGAKEIIQNKKPDMEICVYHRISDFYNIPLLLKEILPEYKFYLRCHSNLLTMECVLYATC